MREHTAGIERQALVLHRDLDVQPVRKHGKPRSESAIRNVDAGDEGRWMRESAAVADRGPGAEISIAKGKERLDLALARRVHAVFDQEPARIGMSREKKIAHIFWEVNVATWLCR